LYKWTDLNDPVMGGQSTSTFTVKESEAIGIFNGTVRIVPSLKVWCSHYILRAFALSRPRRSDAAVLTAILLKH
jgi:hypothetical protein